MKRLFSLFFIFLFIIAFSQKTISGVVKDNEGSLVSSASVIVEEIGKDAIVAYAITNSKGEYKITFTSPEPNIQLKVKAYNHKLILKTIKNESQTQNFTLEVQATEIKEVKLKAKIITKRGDTISYDIKAFENKSDRTLADVMKKIPGIDINSDGTILYQGNAINKFYVNGKDLMEGSYGTINNSLPKDAVQKVEVMENHQPVKILQDKVVSEAAAINVKLKNSVTMTGRGEAGSGFGDPWLWNVKLTPMFFGQKSQWVINYKTNNVGETVENEGNLLAFGGGWEGIRRSTSQNDWLDVENASTPNLPEKRYLFNNVHYLSANYLINPFKNKEWELKANASYTNNAVSRESYQETNYFDAQHSKAVTDILNHFYTDKVKGEVIFTKNAKKGFFKNTTTFTQFWNADRANVTRNSSIATEALQSPTVSFQNSLSAIIPWKDRLINVMSYINYQDDKQTSEIRPGNYIDFSFVNSTDSNTYHITGNTDKVVQNLNLKSFETDHSVNVSFIKKNWTFTPEVGLNFSTNTLTSDLAGLINTDPSATNFGGENLKNNLKFTETVPYANLRINYKSESWMVFSRIPINFNNITAHDDLRRVSKSLSKATFEPNLFAQYSFASFWKASINGGISNNFGNINNIYGGLILMNPSTLNIMDVNNPIMETNSKSAGSRIEYRNPLNNIFFNINYRYSKSDKNLISSPTIDALGFTRTEYKLLDNSSDSNSYSAEIGKYLPKFKTNISVSYGNTLSNSQSLFDGTLLNVENKSQNTVFKFNNAYLKWLSVDFNLTYTWRNTNTFSSSSSKTATYNHNLSTFIYPIDNHTIGFNWDQINSTDTSKNTSYRNPFFDVSYQYTWAKKKVDFELKWINVANRKIYETYSLATDGSRETYTKYQLRPSQVMLTVKFNFK